MTGADDFFSVTLFTAEWLFYHLMTGDFTFNAVYQDISERLGYQPKKDHVTNTIRSCGFYKVTRSKTGTTNKKYTGKFLNGYLSSLYGYLATKEQDDPGPLQHTVYDYKRGMRGCYSFDYEAVKPYVLRYLYYNREPGDLVLTSEIENLREGMNLTDWIGYERYRLCCARVLNEVGYAKRSNKGRCFDPIDVTRAKVLRHLERCHWELPDENKPTSKEIMERYRKNGVILKDADRYKALDSPRNGQELSC